MSRRREPQRGGEIVAVWFGDRRGGICHMSRRRAPQRGGEIVAVWLGAQVCVSTPGSRRVPISPCTLGGYSNWASRGPPFGGMVPSARPPTPIPTVPSSSGPFEGGEGKHTVLLLGHCGEPQFPAPALAPVLSSCTGLHVHWCGVAVRPPGEPAPCLIVCVRIRSSLAGATPSGTLI